MALSERRQPRWPYLLSAHVFEKIRQLDITLAEFEHLMDSGEIIEETTLSVGVLKELVLVLEWTRPLHVVVVVHDLRREEKIVTVYEPDPEGWSRDYRKRRR